MTGAEITAFAIDHSPFKDGDSAETTRLNIAKQHSFIAGMEKGLELTKQQIIDFVEWVADDYKSRLVNPETREMEWTQDYETWITTVELLDIYLSITQYKL